MTSDTEPNPTLEFVTVVPLSFQLCGWIPAWWSGRAGGDDLLELLGADLLAQVRSLRTTTTALSAYCPELGVDWLPGPKPVTEAAVAAGQAVILHAGLGGSSVLIPGQGIYPAAVARPVPVDIATASAEFAQAVVTAEHALRESARTFAATPRPASVRPLPPDADPARKALLVRAVRIWSALDAVPPGQRTPEMREVVRASARATLAAYRQDVVAARDRARRFA